MRYTNNCVILAPLELNNGFYWRQNQGAALLTICGVVAMNLKSIYENTLLNWFSQFKSLKNFIVFVITIIVTTNLLHKNLIEISWRKVIFNSGGKLIFIRFMILSRKKQVYSRDPCCNSTNGLFMHFNCKITNMVLIPKTKYFLVSHL